MNKEFTRAHVKANEGFRAKAYDDKTGAPLKKGDTLQGSAAVGYGRDLIHNGLSEVEAEILLADDLEKIARAFDRDLPWWVSRPDEVQTVMVDLAFQTGVAGLEGFKKMLAAIHAGDYATAIRELEDSEVGRDFPERTARNAALLGKAMQGVTS